MRPWCCGWLAAQEGDVVVVTNQSTGDEQWWQGYKEAPKMIEGRLANPLAQQIPRCHLPSPNHTWPAGF